MERLSGLDAVFLAVETPNNPMNIGSLAVFEGPVPENEAIRRVLANRIATIPRCRQRVHDPLGSFVRPIWIDDVHFDPDAHIDHISLRERSFHALENFVSEIVAKPLDRCRPLWHVWIVDGLEDGNWAILAIVHHCLVDGIAGNDLLSAVLSAEPKSQTKYSVSPEPSSIEILLFTLRSTATSCMIHLRGVWRSLTHPLTSWRRVRDITRSAKGLWWRQSHLPISLVGPIGTGRRWTSLKISLDDIQLIQEKFGGTVNDIVVAAVTSGFRDLLLKRGESVENRTLTAMVPVSLRQQSERGKTGNRVANIHARLPLSVEDPITRLRVVQNHLQDLKYSHDAEATGFVMNIGNYFPRPIADRLARAIVQRQRSVETVITNVPGPQSSVHLEASRLIGAYPIAPIAGQVRITVAVWSYHGHLYIGVTADQSSVPDIETLARGISGGFETLIGII